MAIIVPEERGRMYNEEAAINYDPKTFPEFTELKVGDKLQTKYAIKCEIKENLGFDDMFQDYKYRVLTERGDIADFYGFDLYPLDMSKDFYWMTYRNKSQLFDPYK